MSARLLYLNLVASIEGAEGRAREPGDSPGVAATRRARASRSAPRRRSRSSRPKPKSPTTASRSSSPKPQISSAEDNLRTLILDPARADYWTVRLEPTDQIALTPRQIDVDAAIKNALSNRLDLVDRAAQSRNHRSEHQGRPEQHDAGGRFQPQLRRLGQRRRRSGRASGVIERGFGSVLGDAFGGEFPSWTVGVQVQYPIGQTRGDRAVHAGPGPEAAPGADAARRRARSRAAGARSRRARSRTASSGSRPRRPRSRRPSSSSRRNDGDSRSASRRRSTCRFARASSRRPASTSSTRASRTTARSSTSTGCRRRSRRRCGVRGAGCRVHCTSRTAHLAPRTSHLARSHSHLAPRTPHPHSQHLRTPHLALPHRVFSYSPPRCRS